MNTSDELKAQSGHEEKLRHDPEYRENFRMEIIYGDLNEFKDFMNDYQLMDVIASELLRAINQSQNANRVIGYISANTPEELEKALARRKSINISRDAVLQAITRIKHELDAKISFISERGL